MESGLRRGGNNPPHPRPRAPERSWKRKPAGEYRSRRAFALLDHLNRFAADQIPWLDNDLFTGGDAFGDLDSIVDAPPRAHAFLDRRVFRDGEHFLDSREGDDGVERHRDNTLASFDDDVRLGERTRTKHALTVGYLGFDHQRAVALGNGGREARDLSLVFIRVALHSEINRLADADEPRFALGNREAQTQRMGAYQCHHRRAGGQILSHRGLAFAHGTVDGRSDDGIVQLLARDLELGTALH